MILHFRKKLFNDQQISTVIELILLTHNFYLANYWSTTEETFKYFFEHLLLYTVTVIIMKQFDYNIHILIYIYNI